MNRLSSSQKIFVAGLLAFIPTYFIPYLHIDEGNWAAMCQVLFSGEFYKTWSDNKPPFLMEWFWLLSLGGRSMLLLHLLSAIWWVIGALSLRRILNLYFSKDHAFWGGVVMAILGGTLNYGAFSAELALTPFLILACEIACRATQALSASYALSFASGALVALACNIKPTAIILGLFVCAVWIRAKKAFAHALSGLMGGIFVTLITWLCIRVPFKTIFHEAIEINFQYVKFNNHQSLEAMKDVFANIGVALGIAYLSVSLGTLAAIFLAIKKLRLARSWNRSQLFHFAIGVWLFILSYKTISMGDRWFQQYFVAIVPCLVFFSVYTLQHRPQLKKILSIIAVISLSIFQSKVFYLQATDQNKNWNSSIQKVIDDIRNDTQEGDRIWISNALGMVYHQTHRPPAVKYYFFLHLVKFAETCRADMTELSEDLTNPIYRESIERVVMNPPRVIFWAKRHEHSCSDRIQIQNFPTVKALLDQKYQLVSQSALGDYYRLK